MAVSYKITPSIYKHVQASAATVWTVAHNTGTGGGGTGVPIVDVFISNNGETVKIIPLRVEYLDANTVEIEFSVATAGTAIVIV